MPVVEEDGSATFIVDGRHVDGWGREVELPTEDVEVDSYEQLKVADLRTEAESRGLDASGTKAELVARLEEHDSLNPGE